MMVQALARAKLNLGLEVLGRRPDGYHDIVTVMVQLELADDLVFTPADSLILEIQDSHTAAATEVPRDDRNLILRAARLLQQETGTRKGARILCRKRIPAAAGLGGASSDAATTLLALDRLWHAGLTSHALHRLAARLGSDVPFCLRGGAALVSGRGDRLSPIPSPSPAWVVIATPMVHMPEKTATMYSLLQPEDFSDGATVLLAADALRQGRPLWEVPIWNTFEAVVRRSVPHVAAQMDLSRALCSLDFHLAGAGPSFFALLPSQEAATRCCQKLEAAGVPAIISRTCPRGEIVAQSPHKT